MKKLIENWKFQIATLACAVGAALLLTAGGTYYGGPQVIISSATSGNTNYSTVTNQLWPVAITNNATGNAPVTITNWTAYQIPAGATRVALQFACLATNNVTTSNVYWTIYKAVSTGNTATNAQNTNSQGGNLVQADLLGYVTNTFATNSTTGVASTTNYAVTCATYSEIPRTVAGTYQSTDTGISGVNTLYIVAVTVPGQSGMTNYSVTANAY
jgi:hypothetical protein